MANVLKSERREQVLALGRLGWSLRRIEKETGIRRETVSGYLQQAGIALREPGGWGRRSPPKPANEVTTDSAGPKSAESAKPANGVITDIEAVSDSNPAIEVTTDSEPAPSPANEAIPHDSKEIEPCGDSSVERDSLSLCAPYKELVERELSRNAMGIWQDLVDKHGFAGSYQSVKRFVNKLRGSTSPEARVVIETPIGEECQVDYGQGPMVRNSQTGKYKRTRLFVLTLGFSRKAVRLLTFKFSSQIWVELHEKAFSRLGGCPRVVVLDNLREGVLKPDIYDPVLYPLYRAFLTHYGMTALPCRVRDPDRKGKVESGVKYAQETALKGKRFESLEDTIALPTR
jgi:transposase